MARKKNYRSWVRCFPAMSGSPIPIELPSSRVGRDGFVNAGETLRSVVFGNRETLERGNAYTKLRDGIPALGIPPVSVTRIVHGTVDANVLR